MTPSIILLIIFAYITLLFGIAKWGDRQQYKEKKLTHHPAVYALALGVYCTSWTFYGLVGTASEKGWNYVPILLGPILLFTLGFPILERIFRLCKQEHIHSIADFVASRYGKRQGVAATVSLVALLAIIPYIALQLKAVSDTLALTLGSKFAGTQDLTFITAGSMIGFSLLFGAKRLDVTGYHSGLMSAIAFESIVKLVVFITIAFFAIMLINLPSNLEPLSSVGDGIKQVNSAFFEQPAWSRFAVETLISMCAVFCLPRMFHVGFVECQSIDHLKKSRWLFTLYLIVTMVCIYIIAWVGNLTFFNDADISGDTYMIALPLVNDVPWLALLAFLGGFSAATAMVIVATVTLSQMLSNDVILPLLVRRRQSKNKVSEYSRSLIVARRLTVILVVMGGYFYHRILAENVALTSIGLIAFALVVQLAPAIIFGLYWRKGNSRGLYAGLTVGLAVWFYTLMIPLLGKAGLVQNAWITDGFLGLTWLRPEFLFGLHFSDAYSRGVILSLGANIIFYCWYSFTSKESFTDRIQATAFTRLQKADYDTYDDIEIADLRSLLEQFLGVNAAETLFFDYEKNNKNELRLSLLEKAQRALAGTVGIASAQAMIEGLRSGKKMAVEEVVNLFGETTKALRFNQDVLFSSFENISSGISVVDNELKLVAWNSRYEDMFDYPEGFLKIGLHVSDVIRFNGERGFLGEGRIEDDIQKRLKLMSLGESYRVLRNHNDNVTIEIKGTPLPYGGYVTTYDDISQFIKAQRQLEGANVNLEERVKQRTQQIAEINDDLIKEIERRSFIEIELRQAKKIADEANASKTKFLALAGHDIMQPLNAAGLYVSAISEEGESKNSVLLSHLKKAIDNTESIISSLIEISKVDSGAVKPKLTKISIDEILLNLVHEARAQVNKGVDIRYSPSSLYIISDPHYLRRILQNLIVNAVKYTQSGKVLVGCRRRLGTADNSKVSSTNGSSVSVPVLGELEICILDNGPGISQNEQTVIFDEFYRSDRHQQHNIPGIGLGLSVVKRFSGLLGHKISYRSELHRGSMFSIRVPIADETNKLEEVVEVVQSQDELEGLNVLYVDDDPQNLLATSSLLERWSCSVNVLENVSSAREYAQTEPPPSILLMDYQLGEDLSGIELAQELLGHWQHRNKVDVAVCIVSALPQTELSDLVEKAGFEFLNKPLKPAKLRALLTQMRSRFQS